MLGGRPQRTGDPSADRRVQAAAALGRRRACRPTSALVIADFAWMWPIFTGGLLTYDTWHAHMWLPSWV